LFLRVLSDWSPASKSQGQPALLIADCKENCLSVNVTAISKMSHKTLTVKDKNLKKRREIFLSDEDWDFIEQESRKKFKGRNNKKAAFFREIIEFWRLQAD